MKIQIKDDVFDIVKRVKQIDEDYFILYDTTKKIYELHCCNQKESFCLSLPYDCLDQRTIDKTLATRKQNKDKLLKEIEQNNQKLERSYYAG